MNVQMMVLLGTSAIIFVLISILVIIGKRLSGKLSTRGRKLCLIAHILCVIVYFSGLLGQLLLAILTTTLTDKEYIFAALFFIELFDNYLIIPGAFTTLITGVWLAIRTSWGFSVHYWVICKWVGNIAAILLGSFIIGGLIHNTFPKVLSYNIHPLQNPVFLEGREMLFIGIAICMVILISLVVISYLKPWGKLKKFSDVTTLKH